MVAHRQEGPVRSVLRARGARTLHDWRRALAPRSRVDSPPAREHRRAAPPHPPRPNEPYVPEDVPTQRQSEREVRDRGVRRE